MAFEFVYFSMYPKPCIQKKTKVLCMSLRTIQFWFNNWNGCDQIENKVTVFSKKLLRAIQGLARQHIFMCKIPLLYLFLAMWSKRSYFERLYKFLIFLDNMS